MHFRIEYVLYFYSLISIALVFYNIRYVFHKSKEDERHEALVNKYIKEYDKEIISLKKNKDINKKYYKKLIKELRKVNNLLAFHDFIMLKRKVEDSEIYGEFIYDVFLELSIFYNRKSDMEKALFVHMVGHLNIEKDDSRSLDNRIINFLEKPSVYLVENTISAFIILGHKDSLIKTLNILNFKKVYHNEKLISDGLLEYKGNKLELAKELWEYRREWMVPYVISIIKFIRVIGSDFKEQFYYALTQENLHIEIKIELIRYFGKIKYDKVLDYLLEVFESKEDIDTNFLIVASTVLSNYPSRRTIEVLKRNMTNSNWYIRNNSCASFLSLNPSQEDINDILNGDDRYGKETLLYQLEKRG